MSDDPAPCRTSIASFSISLISGSSSVMMTWCALTLPSTLCPRPDAVAVAEAAFVVECAEAEAEAFGESECEVEGEGLFGDLWDGDEAEEEVAECTLSTAAKSMGW